jgi:hypothetical protein
VRSVRSKVKIAPNKVIMTDSLKRKREPVRGSPEALNEIRAKQVHAISKPVIVYKNGIYFGTFVSRGETEVATGVTVSTIIKAIRTGNLVKGMFTFTDDDYFELKKEKKWFKAWSPDGKEYEMDIKVTLCGLIQVSGRKPTWGTDCKEYKVVSIGGHKVAIHRIMWATWNEKPIPKGYQIDHIDGNKHNNHCSNLKLCSSRDHVLKTRETTDMLKNNGNSQSHSLRLVESRNKDLDQTLIGQIKKTSEWSRLIPNITALKIALSVLKKGFAKGLYKFERVVDELCEGEEYFPADEPHWIWDRTHTKKLYYRVTNFGRYVKPRGDLVGGIDKTGQRVCIPNAGYAHQIHTLVCLAKEGLHEVPEGKTVDHIHGIDGQEWPDRPSNLRFATPSEQNKNRAPRPTIDGPGPE